MANTRTHLLLFGLLLFPSGLFGSENILSYVPPDADFVVWAKNLAETDSLLRESGEHPVTRLLARLVVDEGEVEELRRFQECLVAIDQLLEEGLFEGQCCFYLRVKSSGPASLAFIAESHHDHASVLSLAEELETAGQILGLFPTAAQDESGPQDTTTLLGQLSWAFDRGVFILSNSEDNCEFIREQIASNETPEESIANERVFRTAVALGNDRFPDARPLCRFYLSNAAIRRLFEYWAFRDSASSSLFRGIPDFWIHSGMNDFRAVAGGVSVSTRGAPLPEEWRFGVNAFALGTQPRQGLLASLKGNGEFDLTISEDGKQLVSLVQAKIDGGRFARAARVMLSRAFRKSNQESSLAVNDKINSWAAQAGIPTDWPGELAAKVDMLCACRTVSSSRGHDSTSRHAMHLDGVDSLDHDFQTMYQSLMAGRGFDTASFKFHPVKIGDDTFLVPSPASSKAYLEAKLGELTHFHSEQHAVWEEQLRRGEISQPLFDFYERASEQDRLNVSALIESVSSQRLGVRQGWFSISSPRPIYPGTDEVAPKRDRLAKSLRDLQRQYQLERTGSLLIVVLNQEHAFTPAQDSFDEAESEWPLHESAQSPVLNQIPEIDSVRELREYVLSPHRAFPGVLICGESTSKGIALGVGLLR